MESGHWVDCGQHHGFHCAGLDQSCVEFWEVSKVGVNFGRPQQGCKGRRSMGWFLSVKGIM